MKQILALLLAVTLSPGISAADPASDAKVGWGWLVQYSYLKPDKKKGHDKILVQMYDDGRVEYIRHEPLAGNAAWHRTLKKTPKEVEAVKREIEAILAKSKDDPKEVKKGDRTLEAGIIVRTSEELVKAWGNDKYGDPHPQERAVFKNWRDLDDDAHQTVQKVFQRFNDEAETLEWKWN